MMIAMPKKRCSSDQNMVKPLLNWIGQQNLNPDDFQKTLEEFDELRMLHYIILLDVILTLRKRDSQAGG